MKPLLIVALVCGAACSSAPSTRSSPLGPSTPPAPSGATCSIPASVSRRPQESVTAARPQTHLTVRLGQSAAAGGWLVRLSWDAQQGDVRAYASSVDYAPRDLVVGPVSLAGAMTTQEVCWSSPAGETFTADVTIMTYRGPHIDVRVDAWVP